MKANQAELPVRAVCKTLGVSHSGYYDWLDRPACAQAQANAVLLEQIRQAHLASDTAYGALRIQAELADQGIKAGHDRIASVMRANGQRGVSRRRGWCVTTRRDKEHRRAPDLVQREFTATGINQLWVAGMTYIPTWVGFVYSAVVLDVYRRKVVGLAFGQRQTADLVIAALNMALITRKPQGVIQHSDSKNALASSRWIEGWYNPRRRHSGTCQKFPINFEKELREQACVNTSAIAELTTAGELKIQSIRVREIRVSPVCRFRAAATLSLHGARANRTSSRRKGSRYCGPRSSCVAWTVRAWSSSAAACGR